MERDRFYKIIEKVQQGTASEEEVAEYNRLYMSFQNDKEWNSDIHGNQGSKEDEIYRNIEKAIFKKPSSNYKYWIAVAATILFTITVSLYNYLASPLEHEFSTKTSSPSTNIVPGGDKAVLILADGSEVLLDQINHGEITEFNGVKISKSADGLLVYEVVSDSNSSSTQFHTISIPRGGQYKVVLPDGTQVWVNSSSTLKYPTKFALNERRVELNGEAYFEVVSNDNQPFIVETEQEIVKVLGTEFNLNAYPDEVVSRTTLIGGRVKISPRGNSSWVKELSPGQQGIVHGNDIQIVRVNTSEAVAWKNGEFMFNRESIGSVMRKIARWYDVEVIYKKPIGDDVKIWGTVSRFDNISEVLKLIEHTKTVRFKVEGRKVYVIK